MSILTPPEEVLSSRILGEALESCDGVRPSSLLTITGWLRLCLRPPLHGAGCHQLVCEASGCPRPVGPLGSASREAMLTDVSFLFVCVGSDSTLKTAPGVASLRTGAPQGPQPDTPRGPALGRFQADAESSVCRAQPWCRGDVCTPKVLEP